MCVCDDLFVYVCVCVCDNVFVYVCVCYVYVCMCVYTCVCVFVFGEVEEVAKYCHVTCRDVLTWQILKQIMKTDIHTLVCHLKRGSNQQR